MGRCNGEEAWKVVVRVFVDLTLSGYSLFNHTARGNKRILVHLATINFLQSVSEYRATVRRGVFVPNGQEEDSRQFRLVASQYVVNKGRAPSVPAGGG